MRAPSMYLCQMRLDKVRTFMVPVGSPVAGRLMTDIEELSRIVKTELGNRGYVVNLHAHREGDYVVARLQVTSADTDTTVAKVVGVGNVEDVNVCFGVDAEGTLRDLVAKMLGAWEGVRGLMPSFEVKAPRP